MNQFDFSGDDEIDQFFDDLRPVDEDPVAVEPEALPQHVLGLLPQSYEELDAFDMSALGELTPGQRQTVQNYLDEYAARREQHAADLADRARRRREGGRVRGSGGYGTERSAPGTPDFIDANGDLYSGDGSWLLENTSRAGRLAEDYGVLGPYISGAADLGDAFAYGADRLIAGTGDDIVRFLGENSAGLVGSFFFDQPLVGRSPEQQQFVSDVLDPVLADSSGVVADYLDDNTARQEQGGTMLGEGIALGSELLGGMIPATQAPRIVAGAAQFMRPAARQFARWFDGTTAGARMAQGAAGASTMGSLDVAERVDYDAGEFADVMTSPGISGLPVAAELPLLGSAFGAVLPPVISGAVRGAQNAGTALAGIGRQAGEAIGFAPSGRGPALDLVNTRLDESGLTPTDVAASGVDGLPMAVMHTPVTGADGLPRAADPIGGLVSVVRNNGGRGAEVLEGYERPLMPADISGSGLDGGGVMPRLVSDTVAPRLDPALRRADGSVQAPADRIADINARLEQRVRDEAAPMYDLGRRAEFQGDVDTRVTLRDVAARAEQAGFGARARSGAALRGDPLVRTSEEARNALSAIPPAAQTADMNYDRLRPLYERVRAEGLEDILPSAKNRRTFFDGRTAEYDRKTGEPATPETRNEDRIEVVLREDGTPYRSYFKSRETGRRYDLLADDGDFVVAARMNSKGQWRSGGSVPVAFLREALSQARLRSGEVTQRDIQRRRDEIRARRDESPLRRGSELPDERPGILSAGGRAARLSDDRAPDSPRREGPLEDDLRRTESGVERDEADIQRIESEIRATEEKLRRLKDEIRRGPGDGSGGGRTALEDTEPFTSKLFAPHRKIITSRAQESSDPRLFLDHMARAEQELTSIKRGTARAIDIETFLDRAQFAAARQRDEDPFGILRVAGYYKVALNRNTLNTKSTIQDVESEVGTRTFEAVIERIEAIARQRDGDGTLPLRSFGSVPREQTAMSVAEAIELTRELDDVARQLDDAEDLVAELRAEIETLRAGQRGAIAAVSDARLEAERRVRRRREDEIVDLETRLVELEESVASMRSETATRFADGAQSLAEVTAMRKELAEAQAREAQAVAGQQQLRAEAQARAGDAEAAEARRIAAEEAAALASRQRQEAIDARLEAEAALARMQEAVEAERRAAAGPAEVDSQADAASAATARRREMRQRQRALRERVAPLEQIAAEEPLRALPPPRSFATAPETPPAPRQPSTRADSEPPLDGQVLNRGGPSSDPEIARLRGELADAQARRDMLVEELTETRAVLEGRIQPEERTPEAIQRMLAADPAARQKAEDLQSAQGAVDLAERRLRSIQNRDRVARLPGEDASRNTELDINTFRIFQKEWDRNVGRQQANTLTSIVDDINLEDAFRPENVQYHRNLDRKIRELFSVDRNGSIARRAGGDDGIFGVRDRAREKLRQRGRDASALVRSVVQELPRRGLRSDQRDALAALLSASDEGQRPLPRLEMFLETRPSQSGRRGLFGRRTALDESGSAQVDEAVTELQQAAAEMSARIAPDVRARIVQDGIALDDLGSAVSARGRSAPDRRIVAGLRDVAGDLQAQEMLLVAGRAGPEHVAHELAHRYWAVDGALTPGERRVLIEGARRWRASEKEAGRSDPLGPYEREAARGGRQFTRDELDEELVASFLSQPRFDPSRVPAPRRPMIQRIHDAFMRVGQRIVDGLSRVGFGPLSADSVARNFNRGALRARYLRAVERQVAQGGRRGRTAVDDGSGAPQPERRVGEALPGAGEMHSLRQVLDDELVAARRSGRSSYVRDLTAFRGEVDALLKSLEVQSSGGASVRPFEVADPIYQQRRQVAQAVDFGRSISTRDAQPRMKTGEAQQLFPAVFTPRRGQPEVRAPQVGDDEVAVTREMMATLEPEILTAVRLGFADNIAQRLGGRSGQREMSAFLRQENLRDVSDLIFDSPADTDSFMRAVFGARRIQEMRGRGRNSQTARYLADDAAAPDASGPIGRAVQAGAEAASGGYWSALMRLVGNQSRILSNQETARVREQVARILTSMDLEGSARELQRRRDRVAARPTNRLRSAMRRSGAAAPLVAPARGEIVERADEARPLPESVQRYLIDAIGFSRVQARRIHAIAERYPDSIPAQVFPRLAREALESQDISAAGLFYRLDDQMQPNPAQPLTFSEMVEILNRLDAEPIDDTELVTPDRAS